MNRHEYRKEGYKRYEALAREIKSILDTKIKESNRYRLQQIQHRAKTCDSVECKLRKRNKLDTTDIQSVCKDLAGCRVVFYNNFDVECFGYNLVVPDLFEVDIRRTKFHVHEFDEQDPRKMFESYNFVVFLRKDHPKHEEFAGMCCEIQVQTALNHMWSEMAHDIIYKPCHGTETMNDEEKSKFKRDLEKFAKMKNSYIAPASRISQNLVNDTNRDKIGKDRFDRQTLQNIVDAETNRERYDLLKKLNEDVIPNFDDMEPEISELRYHLEKTWRQVDCESDMDFTNQGVEEIHSHKVTKLIVDTFRKFWKYGPDITYSIIVRLYVSTKCEESREQLVGFAKHISKNTKEDWDRYGPLAQLIIARKLEKEPRILEAGEIICAFAEEILNPEVTGDELKSDRVIIHRDGVRYSHELKEARKIAIDCLFKILEKTDNTCLSRQVIDCLLSVPNLPVAANFEDKLAESVTQDSIDAFNRLINLIPTSDFSFLNHFEEKLYGVWISNKRVTEKRSNNKSLVSLTEELSSSILKIVRKLNSDREFAIYKVLVVITPFFEPHWEVDVSQIDDQQGRLIDIIHDYRMRELNILCRELCAENYHIWRVRLKNLLSERALGPSTSDSMEKFLRLLSEKHSSFVFDLLISRDEFPDWTVVLFASILLETSLSKQTMSVLCKWMSERKCIVEVTDVLSRQSKFQPNIILDCVEAAIQQHDIDALSSMLGLSARSYLSQPEFWRDRVFVPVVYDMINQGSYKWIDSTWSQLCTQSVYSTLTNEQKNHILDAIVRMNENNHQVERVIVALSSNSPFLILQWIEKRIEHSEICAHDSYKVFPTCTTWFHLALQKHPNEVVSSVLRWSSQFDISKHWEICEFLKLIFLDCYENLVPVLLDKIAGADTETLLIVVSSLQGFEGDTRLLPVLREIVASPSCNQEIQDVVLAILKEDNGMNGKDGEAKTFERKINEISHWLNDSNHQVVKFATRTTEKFKRRAKKVRQGDYGILERLETVAK